MSRNTAGKTSRMSLLLALCLAVTASARAAIPHNMRKVVTKNSNFILYLPPNWTAQESVSGQTRALGVSDPTGQYHALVVCGACPAGANSLKLTALMLRGLSRQSQGFSLADLRVEPGTGRTYARGTFVDRGRTPREYRAWTTTAQNQCMYSQITGPKDKLAAKRQVLMDILANVRLGRDSFKGTLAPPKLRTRRHTLRDRSASFNIPVGWEVQEFGGGFFIARDPSHTMGLMSLLHEAVTPGLGVRVPGTPTSWCLRPSAALNMFFKHIGGVKITRYLTVRRRADLERQGQKLYTLGQVTVEEFTYDCVGKGGKSKGYSLGVTYDSRLKKNWKFWHLTVWARNDLVGPHAGDLIAALNSFSASKTFVKGYVATGLAELRRMQQRTYTMIRRNADDIRRINLAAHSNRMKSSDYTSYLFTRYMRGEQDWISNMEGGRVYRSDTWGVHELQSGRTVSPVDYTHFTGNLRYEKLTPVRDRAQWEKYILTR